jgi:hypothetical protein
VPVQFPPASEVLAAIVDRICFKALQLFECMQRGYLPFASPLPKQLQQSFHPSMLGHQSLDPTGHGNSDFMWHRIG